jgi:hypothetical protein
MTVLREIPFDFASVQANGESWRRNFAWPIAQSEATPVLDAQLTRLMRFIVDLDVTPERECVILCAPRILFRVRALTETALAIQAEASRCLKLIGGPLEVAWLRGDIKGEAPKSETSEQLAKVMDGRVRHAFLRRLVRTASWTPLIKLPQTLLAPEILAITHSDLVRKESKRSGQRTNFFHAHNILASARQRFSGRGADFDIGNLVERLTDVLAAVEELEPDMRVRLHALMYVEADWRIRDASIDLAALTEEPRLPKVVWSASGGPYAARAVGLEVLRRGGEAIRHDHSGTTGLSLPHEIIALLEFSASSRFVLATRQAAEIVGREAIGQFVNPYRTVELGHSDGYPSYSKTARLAPAPGGRKPKVIYAPTMLTGFQSHTPALPQDLVYLDLQIRLTQLMSKMRIDVVCKPHLEGLLRGQVHPLAGFAPTSSLPFEHHMEEADVFVFDYTRSTTTWKALCTDRRVVLVDLGLYPYTDHAKPQIEQRCRIVRATFDGRGRLLVNPEELEEAILGASLKPDPTWFRRQFLESVYVN